MLHDNLYYQLWLYFSKIRNLDRELGDHYEIILKDFDIDIKKILINDQSSKFLQLIVSLNKEEEKIISNLIFKELNRQLLNLQKSQIKNSFNDYEIDFLQNNFLIWKLQENPDGEIDEYFTNVFKEIENRLKILEEIEKLNIENTSIDYLTRLNDSLTVYRNSHQKIYQGFDKKAKEYAERLNSLIISKNKYLFEFYLKSNDIIEAYKHYDNYCQKIKCKNYELLQFSALEIIA